MAETIEIKVPDIGGAADVDVIELLVKVGEHVSKEQSLITLEGDKATMDIPSPAEGTVEKILVKIGDKVAQDSLILLLKTEEKTAVAHPEQAEPAEEKPDPAIKEPTSVKETTPDEKPAASANTSNGEQSSATVSAGPAVRRLARELGVNLADVAGSGRKSRLTKEDIQSYVKTRMAQNTGGSGLTLPTAQTVDFSKFGSVEVKPLSKIKRLTGQNLHRSWLSIPHVTQFDEADITDLESFRKDQSAAADKSDYKLTLLAFVTKVIGKALQKFPQFNASLDASGDNLIYKNYYNIGIAVETPGGLVVPVIRGVNELSVGDIALAMGAVSSKARDKGLSLADMSGGCFTISSLGGIGGTAFTPIVNSPEVAILGLSRSIIKPVFAGGNEFKPRLMLPLSLSYDHRVIDGAEAARFTRFIAEMLGDIRKVLV